MCGKNFSAKTLVAFLGWRPKAMSRYPMPLPFSWYTIYHADQLKPQDVVPLRYFGRDLVLFRTQSGKPQLLDAFCPHLGAHLGVGGFVEGESVVCPFHNWAWDGSGKCTSIPYADKMPPRMNTLRIRHYELIEKNQMIYAWFHPENKKPFLDMPEISQTTEAQWGPPKRFRWTMKVHIQEMAEMQWMPRTSNMSMAQNLFPSGT